MIRRRARLPTSSATPERASSEMTISFNPLAERELNDAAQYYDLESPGLGSAFLAEVEHTFNRIEEHPEAAAVIRGAIRRRLVRRFPYAVLYRLRDDEVRILAVMNLRRRPNYWIGRS
jgi:toxin ParE1/3/4